MLKEKYSVYVIECDEKKRYIGLSVDTKTRLDQHNNGLSQWTKRYNNWRIIYEKRFGNYTEARKWEILRKKQKGGNGLRKLIGK